MFNRWPVGLKRDWGLNLTQYQSHLLLSGNGSNSRSLTVCKLLSIDFFVLAGTKPGSARVIRYDLQLSLLDKPEGFVYFCYAEKAHGHSMP